LILSRLQTENFRNLEAASIEFHPRTNLIVGRNGQGKTNLLEAIYFLATTKSFRTARAANMVRFGAETVFAQGVLARAVERTMSVGLDVGEHKRRVLMINGARVVLHTYLDAMTVFAYSAARLEILRGSPEERRRFVDRGVASIDQGYLASVSRFGRVLKQRNALLQSGTAAGIEAWDAEFVEAATLLQSARARYVDMLRASLDQIRQEFSVRAAEMTYRPSVPEITRRRDELRAGVSLSGPQRDHLDFTIEGRPAHEVLSGGEQKMVVLLLKFAKLRLFRESRGEDAIFILDDLDAELDIEILGRLLARLPVETQVFATSAKEQLVGDLADGPHRRLSIENGRLMAAKDFA
jgi:DNA replication and repair protein RecF